MPNSTVREQCILQRAVESSERTFEGSALFQRLSGGGLTPEALKYVFGQYGHFRAQLPRWFAQCILLSGDASQPAQRQAVLALADHIVTDLRDNHDGLFAELLHELGFPPGSLHASHVSSATAAYIVSFLDDCRAPTVTWAEAIAALAGRELSVVIRNQRLLRCYFSPRGLRAPTWLALHAELEREHFLDLLRPILAHEGAEQTPLEALQPAMDRTIARHAEYLDALLQEHDA